MPMITSPTTAGGLLTILRQASLQSPVPCGSLTTASICGALTGYFPASLMRGLSRPYEMSTIRLTSTTITAMKRIPPWSTG